MLKCEGNQVHTIEVKHQSLENEQILLQDLEEQDEQTHLEVNLHQALQAANIEYSTVEKAQ